jgi:hypothetical protein
MLIRTSGGLARRPLRFGWECATVSNWRNQAISLIDAGNEVAPVNECSGGFSPIDRLVLNCCPYVLLLDWFGRDGALYIVVHDVVDPYAYQILPHPFRVKWI